MRADQDAGHRFRPWARVRFRLWACVPAAVLSIVLLLLALAGELSRPAVLRPVVRVAAWLAMAAWAAVAGLGRADRRGVATGTRPKRLAQRYVLAGVVIAVLSAAAGACLSAPAWPARDGVATGCLALAAVGAIAAWQVGLAIRVDLDAAAHIRGSRPLALPGPRHGADDPGPRPAADGPGPGHGADHAGNRADLPVAVASAAIGLPRRRRPRR